MVAHEEESILDEAMDGETLHAAALLAMIEERSKLPRSRGNGIWILLVTLFLFMGVDLAGNKLLDMAILVSALLVHEFGHYLLMRLFGYQDLQIFFIPAFGAAVTGRKLRSAAWQRALVALAGPLPGLYLGYFLAACWAATGISLFGHLALVFVVLNAFNLLPFHPLDGGRFLFEVLLRRNRVLEVVTKGGALMALLLLAGLIGDWILAAFALLLLGTVGEAWVVATVAEEHGRSFPLEEGEREQARPPRRHALAILKALLRRKTPLAAVAIHERRLEAIWERVITAPPGPLPSLALSALYLSAVATVFILPVLALFFWVDEKEIVLSPPKEGVVRQVELSRFGLCQWRCGLDEEGLLHGDCDVRWPPLCTIPMMKGRFEHGRFSGAFLYHGVDGRILQRVEYGAGVPLRWAVKTAEGAWKEEDVRGSSKAKIRWLGEGDPSRVGGETPLDLSAFHRLRGEVGELLLLSPPPPLLFR